MIQRLLAGAIDYAGVFPPASLPLAGALAEYRRARTSPDRWALGRLVVGTAHLADRAAWEDEPVDTGAVPVSLVVGDERGDRLAAALASAPPSARVEALEVRALDAADVATIGESARSAGLGAFVEVTPDAGLDRMLDAVAGAGLDAKLRTGSVVAAQIPEAEPVARFIAACAARGLAWKATAGLHHALRGEYPLTYEPASARGRMFGFLNVLAAAAAADAGADVPTLVGVLEAPALDALRLDAIDPERLRRRAFVSFGSCSFTEPLDDLRDLRLLS